MYPHPKTNSVFYLPSTINWIFHLFTSAYKYIIHSQTVRRCAKKHNAFHLIFNSISFFIYYSRLRINWLPVLLTLKHLFPIALVDKNLSLMDKSINRRTCRSVVSLTCCMASLMSDTSGTICSALFVPRMTKSHRSLFNPSFADNNLLEQHTDFMSGITTSCVWLYYATSVKLGKLCINETSSYSTHVNRRKVN